jgi:hypothetical protein
LATKKNKQFGRPPEDMIFFMTAAFFSLEEMRIIRTTVGIPVLKLPRLARGSNKQLELTKLLCESVKSPGKAAPGAE